MAITLLRRGLEIAMTRTQLVQALAAKTGMSSADARCSVDVMFEELSASLRSGERVSINGFGTFEVRSRRERLGRNPKTSEPMTIPQHTVVVFRASKELRTQVENGTTN
jgi:nucleoid DNA-binding protein